ncbi:MAG: SNF2-related protein [Gaiellaceae bacterium]
MLPTANAFAAAGAIATLSALRTAERLPFAEPPSPRGSVGLDMPSSEGETSAPERGLTARDAARRERSSNESSDATPEPSLAKRLAYLLQPPVDSFLAKQGVVEWPHPFFDFQRDGIRTLVARDALLLADDMGLGKTVQAAAALRILFRLRRIDSALLVVPASLILQWRRALREWAPELRTSTIRGSASERAYQWQAPVHVYITSYETLRSDFTENPQSPPRRRVWDVVVLDEAQKIKNRESEVSRTCKRLPRQRAWALTGTPLENTIDNLASICEFLQPWQEGDEPLRLSAGPDLLERHRSLQLRRKKSEVLTQLPPKTVIDISLQLVGEQRASYERAERDGILRLKGFGEGVRITHVLELITRLKQICNTCPATGESAKLDDIEERLETLSAEGHKALIFSQYTEAHGVRDVVDRLERFEPVAYTGALTMNERDRAIATFKSEPARKALVLSLRAGGQGLNLQEASYVFHFDRWWNPAVENQAEDRSHRLGQASPVTVYKYVCENTIEERIDGILRGKQALFDQLVDDVSIDLKKHLSTDELFGLFGLEPPPSARSRAVEPPRYGGMTGEEFERYLGDVLGRLEWSVELTRRSRDGGIDLKAAKIDRVGIETRLYVQCKNQGAPVSIEIVRELNGVLDPAVQGVVAAPSGFTAEARRFAAERGIQLWDAEHLEALSGQLQPDSSDV